MLGEINSEKISCLDLSDNNIAEIGVFKKMSIKNLNHLDLSNNFIKSIRVFENLHFTRMKSPRINQNLIDFNLQKNIDILDNLSLNQGTQHFYFYYNNIILD